MTIRTFEQLHVQAAPALPSSFPSSLEQQSAARLPFLPRTGITEPSAERAPEPQLHAAYATLVSAACYLSTEPTTEYAAMLEAVQLLYDLSQEVMGSNAWPEVLERDMEDRLWQSKQLRWERQRSVEAAIRYVKAGAELRRITPPKRTRSRLARWWHLLRQPAQVHPF